MHATSPSSENTVAAGRRLTPDRTITLGVRIFISFFFLATAIRTFTCISRIISLVRGDAAVSLFWVTVLAVLELLSFPYKGYVLHNLWASSAAYRCSPSRYADLFLLLAGIEIPMFNAMATVAFPRYLEEKSVFIGYIFLCSIVSFALPPAHVWTAWITSSLPFL